MAGLTNAAPHPVSRSSWLLQASVLLHKGTPHHTPHPYLLALVMGPRHDVGLVLNSDYGQNYLTLYKHNSGEAQSFVRARLSLSGGRQEKFGER